MFSLWSTELSALIGPSDPVLCLRVTGNLTMPVAVDGVCLHIFACMRL